MISLDKIQLNTACKVIEIQTQNSAVRRRILDMGITPGVEIVITKIAPLGDPIEIKLRGYTLSFRKADAKDIIVEVIEQ